ncbi:carbamoyltransferase [Deltaproteobacteria bacterium TL4]
MSIKIIGISAFYHDSAAALVIDGKTVAAAQEERFTRKKQDPGFPANAIRFVLEEASLHLEDIDYFVFYDKPFVKFERLLETYLAYAPRGLRSFLMAMPLWLKEKLFLKETLKRELSTLSGLTKKELPRLLFTEHHQAHAASAFFPSPFKKAAVLCLDGVGEWATTSVWLGEDHQLDPLWQIDFPHSLGLLYSAFTYYTGFRVNSGEYKLMGLAPYGEPKYVDLIYEHLIETKPNGSFHLNMKYFDYATGLTMTNNQFAALFGGPPRVSEANITQKEMDLARSIQVVTEQVILNIAKAIKEELKVDNLCLAGGVALNCVANGKLHRAKIFDNIWIQPAAGDAGGALGAALSVWHEYLEQERNPEVNMDSTSGSYLGPSFSELQITEYLDAVQARYQVMDEDELFPTVAHYLATENVIGWFQGRMEFGPRALGGRSILGDPRSQKMQSTLNLKIKYRESFRPFAPAVKAEKVSDWFDFEGVSPYMLMVANVREDKQVPMSSEQKQRWGLERLKIPRSQIPAVTHVDYSARLQTVHQETNPRFWALLTQFEKITGCPVLINTSFNVRGEPMVCTPEDAYRCFMRTEMDYLVLENVILSKKEQPSRENDASWKKEFALD